MSNKTVRVMFRVTPELEQKLNEYAELVPGSRAAIVREALELHLDRNLPIMRAVNAHNNKAHAATTARSP